MIEEDYGYDDAYYSEKGFKKSQVLKSFIEEDKDKRWRIYFEYCIEGRKFSKLIRETMDTKEDAEKMLKKYFDEFYLRKNHTHDEKMLAIKFLVGGAITIVLFMLGYL